MKGLEPSTFCMASRRSSQLSYIRASASISAVSAIGCGPVEGLVDERVGQLVVLAPDRRVGDAAQPACERGRLVEQPAQRLVLHAVLAAHLPDEQLRVGHDLDLPQAELEGPAQTLDERPVLGDVVRRHPDHLAARIEHGAVQGLQHVAERSRPGVAARAAVGEEPGLQARNSR